MKIRGCVATAVSVALLAVAAPAGAGPSYAVSVFGPAPGHPYGVLATSSAVYAMTSQGAAFRPASGDDMVYTYRLSGGKPVATKHVMTMPTMGLFDAAEDAAGRIYVDDMNGRILRFKPSSHGLLGPETYATLPEPYHSLGWPASMWQCIAFDAKGNLYITDTSQGAIWRVPPNGKPAMWFQSPDFASLPLGGVQGIAVGPDHKLYLAVPGSAGNQMLSTIFRLPITSSSPSSDQLEVFHEFPFEQGGHPTPVPGPSGIAFGKSGKLYVTLTTTDEMAVLDQTGRETYRITGELFDTPLGVRFLGNSLLVANSNALPPEDATHSLILKVDVGEPGLPLIRPVIR